MPIMERRVASRQVNFECFALERRRYDVAEGLEVVFRVLADLWERLRVKFLAAVAAFSVARLALVAS